MGTNALSRGREGPPHSKSCAIHTFLQLGVNFICTHNASVPGHIIHTPGRKRAPLRRQPRWLRPLPVWTFSKALRHWTKCKAGFLFFVKEFLLNISVNITINTFCPLNKILYCSYSATVNSFVHLNSFFFIVLWLQSFGNTCTRRQYPSTSTFSNKPTRRGLVNCERKLFLQSTVLPHR